MGSLEAIDAYGKWIDHVRPPFEVIDGELVETSYIYGAGIVRRVDKVRHSELRDLARAWLQELLDECDNLEG